MAITSTGIGSGLDVDSIVSALVAAERTPAETRLTRQTSVANYQLSGLGTLKSAMASLQTAAQRLLSGASLASRTASSSDTAYVKATGSSDAVPGSYKVEVLQLASAHKIASGTFASADAVLGAGDVTIDVGGDSFTVSLGSEDNSLADLRDAINDASDNTGVSAALLTEDGGTRLVLTSQETGTEHSLTVTTSLATFADVNPAQDAIVEVDDFRRTSSSNSLTDVIQGVTLDLVKADTENSYTVTVANDSSSALSAIRNFVAAYNTLSNSIRGLTAYDAEEDTAGALNGDATVRVVSQQVRKMLSAEVSEGGAFAYLSDIGIKMKTTGELEIDNSALTSAFADDPGAVRRLFGSDGGIATQIDDLLGNYLDDDGPIETKIDALNDRLDSISDETVRLDERMARAEARYLRQFNALDSIVSQYSNTASYLTQLFSNNSSES